MKENASGVFDCSDSYSSLVNQVARRLGFGQIQGLGCNTTKRHLSLCIGVRTN